MREGFEVGPSGRTGPKMQTVVKKIYVVDDDLMVRRSTTFALREQGFDPHPFASGEDFLDSLSHLEPGCVLMDLRMPGLSGLQTVAAIDREHLKRFAVIIVSGHGDMDSAISAMRLGAVNFIEKPYSEDDLISAIHEAISTLNESSKPADAQKSATSAVSQLSPRETEVLRYLGDGNSSKQIAEKLGISPRTVEIHRANLMSKIEQKSLAGAIKIAILSGLVKVQE